MCELFKPMMASGCWAGPEQKWSNKKASILALGENGFKSSDCVGLGYRIELSAAEFFHLFTSSPAD
jgi:hypothetical protein